MFYTTLSHDLRELYSNQSCRFYYLDEIPMKLKKAKYVCEVVLQEGARIIRDEISLKTEHCFIRNPMKLAHFISLHNLSFSVLDHDGLALRFIHNQTPAHCLVAVKQNGLALRFAKYKSESVCNEAVKQNGLALRFIKDQTEQQCLTAVRQNPLALLLVKDKTIKMYRHVFNVKLF